MWNDLRTLFWLEGKRLRRTLAYWGRLLGFDTDATVGYRFYVAIFWAFWIFAMWAYAVEQTYQISRFLDDETTASTTANLPILFGIAQLLYLGILLRDFPLKLRGADIAYVATAPVSRGLLAFMTFLRSTLLPAIVLGLGSILLSMALTWDIGREQAGVAGVQALLLTILTTYITGAAWWVLSLVRAPLPRWIQRTFWLLIPLLLAGGYFLPGLFTFPGQVWALSVGAQVPPLVWLILLVIFAGFAALIVVLGERLHATMIMMRSATFARIAALGVWGRVYARDVIQRIEYQSRMAEKKEPPKLRLPRRFQGTQLLYWHTLLLLLRNGFLPMLGLVGEGLLMTLALSGIILVAGWQAPQTWLIVALILLQRRSAGLLQYYRQTMNGNFLRQFFPGDMAVLFFGTTYAPILLMTFGGWIAVLLLPMVPILEGMLLVLLAATTFALCQALETVRNPFLGVGRLPYEYSLIASGIVIIGSGVLVGSLYAAITAALMVDTVLVSMLNG